MIGNNWNPGTLLQLSGSYWATCTLHAAVKLDVFTALGGRKRTAAELASDGNLSLRGLGMLLDALCALELLTKEGEAYAAVPAATHFLDKSSPAYLGHIIMHHHHLVDGWARLDEAVRSGEPVRNRVSHDAPEVERESFLLGMFNLAMLNAPKVAAQVDLGGRRRLLDLGGGPGTYAIHFCQHHPQLQATIFDLPSTRPIAEQTVAKFALEARIDFVAGDFVEDPLPSGFDVAWLSHVLHGEGEVACARLLQKAVAALEPGGQLLVQEFILEGERTAPLFPALFSLNMLIGTTQGQAYSEPQLRQMLAAAGLTNVARLPLEMPNGSGIVSGIKP